MPLFRQEAQIQGPEDPEAGDPPCAAAQASPHRPEEAAHSEEQGGGVRVRQAAGQEDEGTSLAFSHPLELSVSNWTPQGSQSLTWLLNTSGILNIFSICD